MYVLSGTPHYIKNCWGSQTSWRWKCRSTQHICCLILQRQSPLPDFCACWHKLEWERQLTAGEQNVREELVGCTWSYSRSQSVLSEKSWWLRKVPDSWKKINIITSPSIQKGRSRELLVRSTSVSGKIMEYILLDSISKHMKDKNVIRSRRHQNTKGIVLHQLDCLLWWNDCGWRKSSEHNVSWKAFETICHTIFNSGLRQRGMDGLLEELKISGIGRLQGW